MISEREITQLLATKHHDDIFVSQCKNGPTHGATNLLRMDAWVMKRSWSNWSTIGYEIKSSRSDWIRDKKHLEYSRLVHEFYLVCPPGCISEKELEPEIGLMWTTKSGSKLLTKRKAAVKDIEIPTDLLIYVLMHRANILPHSRMVFDGNPRERWEAWLRAKEDDKEFGRNLRGTIAKRHQDLVWRTQRENEQLRKENEKLSLVKELIEARGISLYLSGAKEIATKLQEVVNDRTIRSIEQTSSDLETLAKKLREINGSIKAD